MTITRTASEKIIGLTPVAQLVEHRAAMREAVSSTRALAGSTLEVLK